MSVYPPGVNSKSKKSTDTFNFMSCKKTKTKPGWLGRVWYCFFHAKFTLRGPCVGCFGACSLPQLNVPACSAGLFFTFQFSFSQLHEKKHKDYTVPLQKVYRLFYKTKLHAENSQSRGFPLAWTTYILYMLAEFKMTVIVLITRCWIFTLILVKC